MASIRAYACACVYFCSPPPLIKPTRVQLWGMHPDAFDPNRLPRAPPFNIIGLRSHLLNALL